MDDLIAFQSARLDEDEAAALAATGTAWAWEATGDKDNSWTVGHVEGEDGRPLSGEIEHGQGIVIDGVCESINGNLADAAHIARHNPGRELREVAVKRRILDLYVAFRDGAESDRKVRGEVGLGVYTATRLLGELVRSFATVDSDHPDYQQKWAP